MKSIKLTKQQKDKLIEMCENLFGFKFAIGTRKIRYYGYKVSSGFVQVGELIDWFEFCFTTLAIKILKNHNDYINFCHICLFCSEKPHPVDYLYDKYKKLNIKNT